MKIVKYYCDNDLHSSNYNAEKTICCSFDESTIDFEIDVCYECLKKIKNNLKTKMNETNDMLVCIRNPEVSIFDDIKDRFISLERLCEIGFERVIERKMK